MNSETLAEQIGRVMAKVSMLDPSYQQPGLLEEISKELKEIYVQILEIPTEPERNALWDEIIRAFQDLGIIVTTVQALVDLLQR